MSVMWIDEDAPDFGVRREKDGTWSVALPHQCDTWDIAGERSYGGVPHAEAVAALEAFLADGQRALEALKRAEPYGDW